MSRQKSVGYLKPTHKDMILAARQGLEPRFLGPEPSVLPLDDRAKFKKRDT